MNFRTDILKLEIVANMLTLESKHGYYYVVESCWKDYGAGIMWETIVCHIPNEKWEWQILSPKEHDMVLNCEKPCDFVDMVRHIQSGKYFHD